MSQAVTREVTQIRAKSSQQKRGGERVKAGKECVLFCRMNSSSQGDAQLGVSPDSPLLGVSSDSS